jgi:crossover junction endodeoxyribonuclease RuvC
MIILGIDPGTATTGYGLIQERKKKKKENPLKCVDYGSINTSPLLSEGMRLKKIEREINKLINKFHPNILATEKLFFFKNSKTLIPVSQAKGIILLAAAKKKVPIFEFTPLEVKMTITGYGRAQKKQVQKMIQVILGLKEIPKPDDAADALALAICCYFYLKSKLKTLDRGIKKNIIGI